MTGIRTSRSNPRPKGATRTRAVALAGVVTLCLAPAVSTAGTAIAAPAGVAPVRSTPQFASTRAGLSVRVPGSAGAPGYRLDIQRTPFRVTTVREGRTVLQTANAHVGFSTAAGPASATNVVDAHWQHGSLDLTLATTVAGDTVKYRITPSADRYRVTWSVTGAAPATQVSANYDVASAGHWYGQGEAQTPDGGPYTRQPWPLDSGTVHDDAMAPAEYLMTDPFWFTERGTGLWVDTRDVMDVSMNSRQRGVFGYAINGASSMDDTVFVERNAHDVYRDYIGISGTPAKSDATPAQYRTPLFNTWAQNYTAVSQQSVLDYAKGLHGAGIPLHTIQIDDGWSTHYGDFDFNSKFPDPKSLSQQIHAMGYDFGLWVTLWINNDAKNHAYAAEHGYLLKSKADPSKPCSVTWWNGTAGIVDLGNPAAKAWYIAQLKNLQSTYGVDGFKFDTRFFDESCAPAPGYSALDYIKLGAEVTDQFDQQGAGVRLSWTGSQKYGFVVREVDKGTGWDSLQAGVAQAMAISTIGYPFVETDMIGGSLGQPPATKDVLVRWAQAASLMPLMYSSTSPLGVRNASGSQTYDAQTAQLYAKAVHLHEALAPYINEQVTKAVRTGEPIMKPLFFDFPDDHASYTVADEWLLGDSLLAAPVLTTGTSRNIHLPAGSWYDVLHHRIVHAGAQGTTLDGYNADLAQTPLFVRLGTGSSGRLIQAISKDARH